MTSIQREISEHEEVIGRLDALESDIERVGKHMVAAIRDGGKVLWMGNGGSAADSQHLAAELVGRFRKDRPAFPSIALTTDTSILSAVGNDYGYENIFERQVEALCQKADVLVGISTSGNSENVIRAIRQASEKNATTVGLTGRSGGELENYVDVCLSVPSGDTARIQEAHILIGHLLCNFVESALTSENE